MNIRTALATVGATAALIGGFAAPAAAQAAPASTNGEVAAQADCFLTVCGRLSNVSQRYIEVKYSQGGSTHVTWLAPNSQLGGNGVDVDFFRVAPGCIAYTSDNSYHGGSTWFRGRLAWNGTEEIRWIAC